MKYPTFGDDLAFSQEPNYQQLMEDFYRQFFGPMSRVVVQRISEIDEQRKGYDVLVKLDSGQFFKIEEKRDRYANTGNIVLELWSDMNRKKGWLYTAQCDWIAYHYDGSAITHMLPMPALRKAWERYEMAWRDSYRVLTRENRGWTTQFILIPIGVLWDAMRDVMVVNHKGDGRWKS